MAQPVPSMPGHSTARRPDLSVVIPVYNSGNCLEELIRQLADVLNARGDSYEILLVDDCSRDDSWRKIRELAAASPAVKGIQLMHNEGQAKATLCGLAHASGELVVTMDDDLQHRPDQMPKLLDVIEGDPELDCVMGYFEEKRHAAYRNLGSAVIRRINAFAFGLPKGIRTSAFRVMRRGIVAAVLRHPTAHPVLSVLIFESTSRVQSVPVEHAPRFAGRSNYSLRRQFALALDNVCNVTMLPLRAASVIGFVTCGVSVLLLFWYLGRFLAGRIHVPGWTTVVLLLTFFSGVILLALGVIGEYLVRVLREVQRRPSWCIRQRVGDPPADGTE